MIDAWPVQGFATAVIEVNPTPLVVSITPDGATKKMVAKDELVYLPAEQNSFDPDDPGNVSQTNT